MNTLKINTFTGEEVSCRTFFDIDPDVSGIDISINENRIGSIIGVILPDEEDEEELNDFKNMVENWLIDNS